MANLTTSYLGLKLKNPLIVGSSPHTSTPEKMKAMEDAGAGAIVCKTLYEEQVELEEFEMQSVMEEYNERNAEMISLFPNIKHAGPKKHLYMLKRAREQVNIPLIASINAVTEDTWVDYATQVANIGVDALELNLYSIPTSFDVDEKSIMDSQLSTLKKVKQAVKIPISVKLSPFYTNPLWVIKQIDNIGVGGFVLFNKMFQPDINTESETLQQSIALSSSEDSRLAIRFAGLLSGNIKGDLASSSGIVSADDAIKTILAGANAFQITSAIFKHGPDAIAQILGQLSEWMKAKGYNSIDDFRGKLSKKRVKSPFAYHRAQYVELMMNPEGILNRKTLP